MKPCTCDSEFYKPVVKTPIQVEGRLWHADGRGKLLECLRADSPYFLGIGGFGQAYVTTVQPGITKAWHMHNHQTDRMILLRGIVRFGCVRSTFTEVNMRTNMTNTLAVGCVNDICTVSHNYEKVLDLVVNDYDPMLIVIPENIYHGFMNVGTTEAYILNIPDNMYDYEKPDEQREDSTYFSSVFNWAARMDG